ncbi:DUF7661 family protein [Variovorax saccharolyticus]|uniref:DUF7661 family protein n=1 Tax=Variovorax saccharolyticus TaxID=3053516 RepID=UPI00257718DE|nr:MULTISPECIES: hypothetical protein [unclassified Variovorax]MDM0017633.1 hypothetical protein [Variovorax sp. J22R187]MDM0028773.1 hypothetical protein [Variovorax sp. J31P216]
MRHLFNVFGRIMAIERLDGRWASYLIGADGKRGKVELAIPADLAREELAQYLYDVYHEDASPTNGDVFEVQRH